jgi:hypothetical protein
MDYGTAPDAPQICDQTLNPLTVAQHFHLSDTKL